MPNEVARPARRLGWVVLTVVGILAASMSAATQKWLPCTAKNWQGFALAFPIGFAFFSSSLLFFVLLSRKGMRRLSLIPLAVLVLMFVMGWPLMAVFGMCS
jgi:hypothetical protein